MKTENKAVDINRNIGDFAYPEVHVRDAGAGLSERTIHYISDVKEDPDWVREFRLRGLKTFLEKPLPTHWASRDLEAIDFDKIRYYLSPGTATKRSWDEVPEDIKRTFERLGIPEQERKFLAGVEAQFDSEAVYSNIKKAVGEQGVIFVGSTEGLKNHPEIFRKWFGKVIPIGDNKFSALNSAVFSGGSFIYVPPGVKVKHPLQAYFRINAENFGQFERTLIIADEGSEVTYMEGCTAPKFNTTTLHSAVVELIALKGAKIQYITVQNWSSNVFNLVTKRGLAHEDAEIKWIDCNIGSRLTMKYPGVIMKGRKARGEVLSIALANDGQHQDTGAKMIHSQALQEQHRVRRASHQFDQPHRHISCDHRARHGERSATRGQRQSGERRANFLHATARPDRSAGDELERQRFRQRSRPPIPDGVQRRAQAPDRAGDGRLGWIVPSNLL